MIMKKTASALVAVLVSLNLAGCANTTNQDMGTLSGGVIGGLLGSQFGHGTGQLLAVGAGALAGAYIGGALGKHMDDTDRLKMNQAMEQNSVGQPAYWRNQKTDASYTVVPTKDVTYDGNPYCREYRSTAIIAGKKQQVYGTACRQPDGSWQMVSN